jgi:hypothetical protein
MIDVAAPIVDYSMDVSPYYPRTAEDMPRKKRR